MDFTFHYSSCCDLFVSKSVLHQHVLGLVKSYWPQTPLDALGKGAKSDCTDEQFNQYLQETSMVADQIVEALNKPESP